MSTLRELDSLLLSKRNSLSYINAELTSMTKEVATEMVLSGLEPSEIEQSVEQLTQETKKMLSIHETNLPLLGEATKHVSDKELDVLRYWELLNKYSSWLSSVADQKSAEESLYKIQRSIASADKVLGFLRNMQQLRERRTETENDITVMEKVLVVLQTVEEDLK